MSSLNILVDKRAIDIYLELAAAEHSDEVLKFAGQCIAIDKHNYGIIASGTTSTEVVYAAQNIAPEKEIILYKVPSDGLSM